MTDPITIVPSATETVTGTQPLPTFHGGLRVLATAIWLTLVVLYAVYMIGFSWASNARINNAVCNPYSTAEAVMPYRGVCVAVLVATEIALHSGIFTSAVLLFLRRSSEFMTIAASIALLCFSAGLSTVTYGLNGTAEFQGLGRAMLSLGFLAIIVFMLIFPDGRFRPAWAAALPFVYMLWTISWFVVPQFEFIRRLQIGAWPLIAISTAPAGYIVWRSYRRYFSVSQQQQTKWVILGAIGTPVVFGTFAIMTFIVANTLVESPLGFILYSLTYIPRALGIALIPLAIFFSIARYRLWDVDLVVNRALVIGGMTAALVAVFMAALLIVQQLATQILGSDMSGLALAAASLAVAALFNPLRARMRKLIDTRIYQRTAAATPLDTGETAVIARPADSTGSLTHVASTHDATPARGGQRANALIGEVVGGYTLTRRLGYGGMAEVYLGERADRTAALKILLPMLSHDHTYRARFVREGRTMTQLDHPHIVRVYAAGEDGDLLYIAMEYIEGETLASLLNRGGRLTLDRAMPIVRGIGSALAYAHRQGVIHRDVKPQNILLDTQAHSAVPRAVLTDFGIARVEAAQTMLTTGSGAIGTLDYIAPEQINTTSSVDGRADVYAFGVVVYQMLTGRLPFKEANAAAMLISHLQKPAPDPRLFAPDIPEKTAGVLLRALAKAPEDRFDNPEMFAEALV